MLINVASMAATMGIPYGSAYNSSKWAVRGFADCLREELRQDGIHVVTVMPASIDTPLFDHAANYTGKVMKPMEPVYPPGDRGGEDPVGCPPAAAGDHGGRRGLRLAHPARPAADCGRSAA